MIHEPDLPLRNVHHRTYGIASRHRCTLKEANKHKAQMFTTTPAVTTWTCGGCGFGNPVRAGSCRRCGGTKS
jgi:hypothetical protein